MGIAVVWDIEKQSAASDPGKPTHNIHGSRVARRSDCRHRVRRRCDPFVEPHRWPAGRHVTGRGGKVLVSPSHPTAYGSLRLAATEPSPSGMSSPTSTSPPGRQPTEASLAPSLSQPDGHRLASVAMTCLSGSGISIPCLGPSLTDDQGAKARMTDTEHRHESAVLDILILGL